MRLLGIVLSDVCPGTEGLTTSDMQVVPWTCKAHKRYLELLCLFCVFRAPLHLCAKRSS